MTGTTFRRAASTVIACLCVSCALAFGEDSKPVPAAAPPAGEDKTLESVRVLVKPWHRFDPKWVREATVIVMGKGCYRKGACVYEDGMFVMPALTTVSVDKTLKGNPRCDEVILGWGRPEGLPYFVEARSYLLFLKPDETNPKDETAKEGFRYTLPGNLVAVVDLSETKSEAEVRTASPVKSGKFGDYEFTPEKWKALREAEVQDFAEQERLIEFLENAVLRATAMLSDIAQYLGRPDHQSGLQEASYTLNLPARRNWTKGVVQRTIELKFRYGGTLASYEVKTTRTKVTGEHSYSSTDLSPDELAKLGLKPHAKSLQLGEKTKPD